MNNISRAGGRNPPVRKRKRSSVYVPVQFGHQMCIRDREADIRRNFDKLMSNQSRIAAKAAGRAVDVSADDFEDAD